MSEFNDEDIIMPNPYDGGRPIIASSIREFCKMMTEFYDSKGTFSTNGEAIHTDYYDAERKGKGRRGDPYELRRRIR